MAHFDLLVIGSGKGGKTLATQMANQGQNVALVEKKWIGGSCINVACIPTKTLVKTAKVAHTLQNLAHYGIVPKPPAYPSPLPLEMHPIFDRKRVVVETMIDRNQQAFDSAGVHLLAGSASFLSNNEVSVDDAKTQTVHSADRIVINTASQDSLQNRSLVPLPQAKRSAYSRPLSTRKPTKSSVRVFSVHKPAKYLPRSK